MLRDNYAALFAPGKRARLEYMGVLAVAVYQDVRFRVTDYASARGKPHYVFDMQQLDGPKDRTGRHLGEPLDIPAKLIQDAQESARVKNLPAELAEVEIIAWILAHGNIVAKLEKKCAGGCPAKFKELLAPVKLAYKETLALAAAAPPPATATSAAPRKAMRI